MPDQRIPVPPKGRWQRAARRRELVTRLRAEDLELSGSLRHETRARTEVELARAASRSATCRQVLASTTAELALYYRPDSPTRITMQRGAVELFEKAADWLVMQSATEQAQRLAHAYLAVPRPAADLTCVTVVEVTR